MEKEKLKRIIEFLETQENKTPNSKGNLRWKLIFNEPLTEEELTVDGDLNLNKTPLTSLPKGLKVTKNLNLYNSLIKSLPEGLEVGGDLNINSTTLTKYTDKELRDMIKPGIIRGFIDR